MHIFIAWIITITFILMFMSGCKTVEPTPFETGEETSKPIGCVMAEVEGRDVDC